MISTGEVALEQIDSVSNLSGVDAPAGAGELALHAEANSAEEHLGPLEAGQLAGWLVSGRGHAVDDALLNAEGNVAGGPAVGSDVLEGSGRALQAVSLVLAQLHVGNDLGSLLTGVVALGLESRLGHAVDDADAGQDTYRLIIRIADLAHVVGEVFDLIVGRGADHAETKNHGDHEYEAQGLLESSHVETPPLNSTLFRGPVYVQTFMGSDILSQPANVGTRRITWVSRRKRAINYASSEFLSTMARIASKDGCT